MPSSSCHADQEFQAMNQQSQSGAPAPERRRIMTALLICGAVITWLVATILVWAVTPLLMADPALAEAADSVTPTVMALALGGASAGLVLLVGLALTWSTPERGVGRALLLIGGLMAAMTGVLLANMGLEFGWTGWAAVVGLACASVQLAVGVLACIASLSDWLPGQSLVEQMRVEAVRPPSRVRKWMPLLTATLAVGWVLCAVAAVARTEVLVLAAVSVVGWFAEVWVMPILAGMVVTGWRETEPNHLQTLGLAAVAGLILDLLFLLVLGLGYYQLNPIGFAVWWAIMGAIFGATGFALWGLLERRGPKLLLRPR
jgi:hypothetical protein